MELNRANMKKIMLLIAFAVLLWVAVQRIELVMDIIRFLVDVFSPFLAGGAIAFILNLPMRFLERTIFGRLIQKKGRRPGFVRPLSMLLTVLLVILVIVVLLQVIIPQLVTTIVGLGATVSGFILRVIRWGEETFANNPEIREWFEELSLDWRTFDWQGILNTAVEFVKNSAANVVLSAVTAVSTVVSGVFSAFIALVFACYVLLQKEKLGIQSRKIVYALLPRRWAGKVVEVFSLSFRIFSSFIAGQCTEALILGSMFFVAMSILRMPYALLISCLICVTALIPIVGAFIGCGVGAFLILMVSPTQALIFVAMFLILQQVEGNLIYPHVVGSSVGLPALWVLMAVTVGGSLMGIVGMMIFIPITSVVYTLFREYVYRRLKDKNIKIQ